MRLMSAQSVFGIVLVCVCVAGCRAESFAVGRVTSDVDRHSAVAPLQDVDLALISRINTHMDTYAPVWSMAGAWSPQGAERFAYHANYGESVMVHDLDTAKTIQVYSRQNAAQQHPSAEFVEFFSFVGLERLWLYPGYNATPEDIYEVVALTGQMSAGPFEVADDVAQVDEMQELMPSPDGQHVLYIDDAGLFTLKDSAGQVMQFDKYDGVHPYRWSPDGRSFLAWQWTSADDSRCWEQFALYLGMPGRAELELIDPNVGLPASWFADGHGFAYVSMGDICMESEDMWRSYAHGTLLSYDVESRKRRVIAENARAPSAVGSPPTVYFSTPFGFAVSNLVQTRYFRGLFLNHPQVSPSGSFLVDLEPNMGSAEFWDIVLYAVQNTSGR